MRNRLSVLIATAAALSVSSALAGDWPRYLGPAGNGVAEGESNLPIEWGPQQNVKWQATLPDDGNSSPIVVGGKVFVTCGEDRGRKRHLFCFDRETGDELWVRTVEHDVVETTHRDNPYCASSPVSDGEHVVVWHGNAGMHCYDMGGSQLWSRDLGEFRHVWGYASSPIIHDGKVIHLCGPGERTFLTALDLKNGETVWETPEPGGSASDDGRYIGSWCTPVVANVGGSTQILCGMPTRVNGYDPESGRLLWSVGGVSSDRSDLMYASLMLDGDVGIAAGGFSGPAMGFKLGGRGDMTLANRLWHTGYNHGNPQRIGTGIIVDGYLYLANADGRGSLECVEAETGDVQWKVPQTDDGPHWGSLVLADGRFYVTGKRGITRVFAPNPEEYEHIAENDLGESSNSTPAISDGEIFLRTFRHVYCISGEG